jgi:hypothetical protein
MMTKALKMTGMFLIMIALVFYIIGVNAGQILGWHLLILGLGLYLFIRVPRMALKPFRWPEKRKFFTRLGWFVFFFALVFFFQFRQVKNFGLYELDFYKVLPAFRWNWQDLCQIIRSIVFSPLTVDSAGDVLIAIFSFIGYQIGGLQGIYWLSMLIPAAISLFFFLIFKKLLGSELPAFFGALLFIFFPAYRTPQLLYLTFSKQAALLLMLCSLYAFLHQRKLLSELLMFATMVIVKAYAPIFLMFPLFRLNWIRRNFWQYWLDHLKATAFPLLWIIAAISMQSGMKAFFFRVLEYLLIPLRLFEGFSKVAFGNGFINFASSPITLFVNFSSQLLVVFLAAWLIFAAIFILRKPDINIAPQNYAIKNALFSGEVKIFSDPNLLKTFKIGLSSLVILIFSFTGFEHSTPANTYTASWSYTYLVNALPMISLLTSIFSVLLLFPRKIYQQIMLILMATVFLSLLGLNRFHSQGYLAQIWQVDQWLWTNILTETETLSDDTKLFIWYSPNEIVLPTRYQNIDIYPGQDLLCVLFEPDPNWDLFPQAFINTGTYSASPQDDLTAVNRVVKFFLLDNQLYVEGADEEGPQVLLDQVLITELNKKPLFDLIFVNEFIGKSLNTALQQGALDVK